MRPTVTVWVAWSSEPCNNGWTNRDTVLDVDLNGSNESCISWGPDPHVRRGQFWWPKRVQPVTCLADYILKATQQRAVPLRCRCRLGCTRWGAHWHNLANTIEPSVCRCDAAFCQITLTTCYIKDPPFPQIDINGAMVIVWRARGKNLRSVLCSIVCNNYTQWTAQTHEQN